MENMKRALSAFLAFVLVLGMVPAVPVFASAEEVETQPETVAVETTQAVTEETEAPETTAAAETVPETEPVQETQTQETVPETTGAQETEAAEETAPAETAPEETIPAETAPEETVPAETQVDLEASEDAMDELVPEEFVTNITVTPSKTKTYVGDEISLSAVVTPDTAVTKDVVYVVLESVEGMEDYSPAGYDMEKLAEGIVYATEGGKLAIGWHSLDGNYDPFYILEEPEEEDPEMPDPIWLEFIEYSMDINTKAIGEDNVDEALGYKVMVGDTMTVSVRYKTPAGEDELAQFPDGYETIQPIHTPNVKWTLKEGDEKFASISVSSDTKQVTITPKSLTETQMITLTAKDQALAGILGEAVEDVIQIWILPVPYKVSVRMEDEEINGKTIPVNVTKYLTEDWIKLSLDADVLPAEANEPMVWTTSDNGTKIIHEKISDDPVEYDTTHAEIWMPVETGKTVLTVTSENDPALTATVTFERKLLISAIAFTEKTTKLVDLISGSSIQLQAVRVLPDGSRDNEVLESDLIQWELSEEDQEYATLTKNGKLTAKKNLVRGKIITVTCSVIDNEEEATLTKEVYIRPKTTDVEIFCGEDEETVNDQTLIFDASEVDGAIQLTAKVYPVAEEEEELGAKETVTWTSNNTAIATVGKESGAVEWKGNTGTVTITATATDGTGKKASVKLTFGAKVQGLYIEAPYRESADSPETGFLLRSGKSWTFDVTFTPKTPSNKGLTWTLEGEEDANYAAISASGRLTAKTVYEAHTVTVRATAKDGSGVYDEVIVTIAPKQDDQLSIQADGEPVTKTTQLVAVDGSLELAAFSGGEQAAVTWGPTKSSVVDVEDHGDGTATVTVKKSGSATITATAADGSKRKATFVVRGVQLAENIEWTHTHEQHNLASGKSLTLKAKAYYEDENGKQKTPTVSKLAWSFAEEDAAKYAVISSSGKVTALSGYRGEPVELTVQVETTDGSGLMETWPITIAPAPEAVIIQRNGNLATAYTFAMTTPGEDVVELTAKAIGSDQVEFTWKSSNTKTATVEDGIVTCLKAGSVTITATANDGSGKKASFKLTIVAIADYATVDAYWDGVGIPVAGGKKLSLKGIALDGNGDTIKGKKFKWYVSDNAVDKEAGSIYASISGSTLKTDTVTSTKRVWLTVMTVESNEDWVAESTFPVMIRPATTSVQILNQNGTAISSAVGYVGKPVENLFAKAKPYDSTNVDNRACQVFLWKSSNPKVADYVWNEETETVELMCFKKGKVTITATAIDGTKKSAKITLEVW